MKLIFLDMDGVMNSVQSAVLFHDFMQLPNNWFKQLYRGYSETLGYKGEICPMAVSNLRSLLKDYPETRFVISSTWRKGNDVDWFNWLFNKVGIVGDAECRECEASGIINGETCRWCDEGYLRTPIPINIVMDLTPIMDGKQRGEEIQQWMDDNPGIMKNVDSFVILDDDSDMAHFRKQPCFIQTDNYVGFDYTTMIKVKHHFGGYILTEKDLVDGERYKMSCKPSHVVYYWDGEKKEPYYYDDQGEVSYAAHFKSSLFAKIDE